MPPRRRAPGAYAAARTDAWAQLAGDAGGRTGAWAQRGSERDAARAVWRGSELEPEPEAWDSESEHGSTVSARVELSSLSVEALKTRAREMRYVNEDTLAAVDDMASPKRYLVALLSLNLEPPDAEHVDDRLPIDGQDPEFLEAQLSESSPNVHQHHAAPAKRDGFRDPELSEAELLDTSPFWHRPEASTSRHQPVVAAQHPASWRPEPDPVLGRVSLAKAQRKFDDARRYLLNPLESERAMTSLESALRLLGRPWDHASQELSDSIESVLKTVPRRYLSDELQARIARQRDRRAASGLALAEAGSRSLSPPALPLGGVRDGELRERRPRADSRSLSPRALSPQASAAAAARSSRRAAGGSPRRNSVKRRQIQEACERAEDEKNEGLILERRRDFEEAVRRYDAALRILEEVHADDKQCADMTALLQRKRQACTHTILQQAGSSKGIRPSQLSAQNERHAHSQRELDSVLDSAEGTITRTRQLLTGWTEHMAKSATVCQTAGGAEPMYQRAEPQQPQPVDSAERKYTAAVETFNRGDGEYALELIEATLDMVPPSSVGSAGRRIQNLRKAVETSQREMVDLRQEQHQLLSDIRAAFCECQAMQEQISSQAWDAVAAASRPGRGRAHVSPGRGGEVKWNSSVTQHPVKTTRMGLKAAVAVKEAPGVIDTGPLSERETRLKTVREKLDSMLRVLRTAQTKRRRGGKDARAGTNPDRDTVRDASARRSPRRQFCNVLSKFDLSTSPTGHGFTVPPPFSEQRQIIGTTHELLHAAIAAQKVHDHVGAAKLLDQALQRLGQPWGGESKRLQEELQRRQRTSARALHRGGTGRAPRAAARQSARPSPPRGKKPISPKRADSREEPRPREVVMRSPTTRSDDQVRRGVQVSFSDAKAGAQPTRQSRGGHQRPHPVDLAEAKYTQAVAAFSRGDAEDALELVDKGLEILPVSADMKIQQLRRTMEEFRGETEALFEQLPDSDDGGVSVSPPARTSAAHTAGASRRTQLHDNLEWEARTARIRHGAEDLRRQQRKSKEAHDAE